MPRRILTDRALFFVPAGYDAYQKPTAEQRLEIHNVHFQGDNITKRVNTDASGYDTEVTLKGVLFLDARYSRPAYGALPDLEELQRAAQRAGGVLTCDIFNRAGVSVGPYTVLTVDALPDDEGRLHHYEIGVV